MNGGEVVILWNPKNPVDGRRLLEQYLAERISLTQ